MFLDQLLITEGDAVVRDIRFRKGVNLIIDETDKIIKTASGNNVGKTSVLRLIDFCLGGKGTQIFEDSEFKGRTNSEVESYLTEQNVLITLVLSADLEIKESRKVEIKRNFLQRTEKILEVNGQAVPATELDAHLKSLIFASSVRKPTFRQIISKNIRYDKGRLQNTLRVLHPTTTAAEYEALYLFWLGIELDVAEQKQRLIQQRRIEENLQTKLRKGTTLSKIVQSLKVIESEIAALETNRKSFNINENYEAELASLTVAKQSISRISTNIARLQLRADLIEESASQLDGESADIDIKKLEEIYDEAGFLLPELQRSFEQVVAFHNGMVSEKRRFITEELPSITAQLANLQTELSEARSRERALAEQLNSTDTVEDFQVLVGKLNEVYEAKGALENQKEMWETSIDTLNSINLKIQKIENNLESMDDLIQERVAVFNSFFAVLSDQLYGEKYVLAADKGEKAYELSISSVVGNPGTGKKLGETAAFDIAYIQFADELGIECLHFVLQDQIENIHDNQITSILTDIVENNNCQYVLPVLRDKLPENLDTDKFQILSLSQQDKLFRI